MEKVRSAKELLQHIKNMNSKNSVCQFLIPGKGKFTLVFQEEDKQSIRADVEASPELKKMINESRQQYKQGMGMSTSDLLKSFTLDEFI